MSKVQLSHQPHEECGSSDALTAYEDGGWWCFSCGKGKGGNNNGEKDAEGRSKNRHDGRETNEYRRLFLKSTGLESEGSGDESESLGRIPSSTGCETPEEINTNKSKPYQEVSEFRKLFERNRLTQNKEDVIIDLENTASDPSLDESSLTTNKHTGQLPKVILKEHLSASGPLENKENNKLKLTKKVTPFRGLSSNTLNFYGVHSRVDDGGNPVEYVFPYSDEARKIRKVKAKDFYAEGSMTKESLFGKNLFSPGSANAITITEGEIDALSVFQMLGSKYPTVSIRGATSGKQDCEREFKFINSFDKIYLCLDNDEPGLKASQEIASLFDVNKVHFVTMGGGCKDANDYLTQGKEEEFKKCWWNAKKYVPKGIINTMEQVAGVLHQEDTAAIASYPFPTLEEMTYGIREGELNLFTALEKVGKTEIMRAIEHHIIKTTDLNVGIIHLEEGEKRSIQGLLSYEFKTPVHLPDCNVSVDEQVSKYKELVKTDGRVNYYSHFGSDDPDIILDVIRYLVGVQHCKVVFLDHITMLVTGFENDDERRKLDYISTRLAMLTRELKFTLFLVSHVNDNGQTRGSRNISKVADLICHLDRDTEAESFDKRNTTSLLVKGNRFAGKSGPAGYVKFEPTSYTVHELQDVDQLQESKVAPF